MPHKIYLGLGSNLGDRAAYLDAALGALPPEVSVQRRSPVYETAPWGFIEQPKFLNMVAEAGTDLAPNDLLKYLKSIETAMGREKTFRNGPRVIDLDILLYDDLTLDEGRLKVPHPNLHHRAFVLAPLADLAPELQMPGSSERVSDLLRKVDASGVRRLEEAK